MASISENIKTLMDSEGISASDLSRVTGIDRSVLHKILTGATKNPSIDSIKAIIQHYSFHEVLYGIKENNSSENSAPIISWSDAINFPNISQNDNTRRYVKIGMQVNENIFCLLIDYTLDSRFPEGTLLIVDNQKTPKNLSYVIIQESDSPIASLKRFIFDGNTPYLKSIDPSFPSIKYDSTMFKMIGVVVQSIFNFE